MATPQQIRANQSNAQLSTGPANTSRTRFNGTQHGLTSKQTVITGESQAEYDAFHASLVKELRPGSETERILADRIAVAAWRLRRFTRIEVAFFSNRIDAFLTENPEQDPDAALANLFTDPAEAQRMRLFLRYQNAVQREYDTAMRLLGKARKERAHQELLETAAVVATPQPNRTETAKEPVEIARVSGNGFASHDSAPVIPAVARSAA